MPELVLKDRVVLDRRFDPGVDWGSALFLLCEIGHKKLLWWTSGKEWAGRMGGCLPRPAELLLYEKRPGQHHSWQTLKEGGRLSSAVLRGCAAKIDEFFGLEVAKWLDPKKTLVEDTSAQGQDVPRTSD